MRSLSGLHLPECDSCALQSFSCFGRPALTWTSKLRETAANLFVLYDEKRHTVARNRLPFADPRKLRLDRFA